MTAERPSLYEWMGGADAVHRLTTSFYDEFVPDDPLLGPLFAAAPAQHAAHVAYWLIEVFGGPPRHSECRGGYPTMVRHHVGRHLTAEQRSRWVAKLQQAADRVGLPTDPEFRAAFVAYLEWGSRIAQANSSHDASPPLEAEVPQWWWVCDATPWGGPALRPPRPSIRRTHTEDDLG
ncbi:MAG: group II truncated hemoglobin [Nocardioides sp.]